MTASRAPLSTLERALHRKRAETEPHIEAAPATFADAAVLARTLRPADRAELRALGVASAQDALFESCRRSDRAWTCRRAGAEAGAGVVAMFGVGAAPEQPDLGVPWMLASTDLERCARPFLRNSRQWVRHLGEGRRALVNIVDARNAASIRWLRWCGFAFVRRLDAFGPERRPFYEFVRISDV